MEQAEIILHTTDSTGKVSDRFLTKFDTEQPPVWKGTIPNIWFLICWIIL